MACTSRAACLSCMAACNSSAFQSPAQANVQQQVICASDSAICAPKQKFRCALQSDIPELQAPIRQYSAQHVVMTLKRCSKCTVQTRAGSATLTSSLRAWRCSRITASFARIFSTRFRLLARRPSPRPSTSFILLLSSLELYCNKT